MALPKIKETITHKIELTPAQLTEILKHYASEHLGFNSTTDVSFSVADTSDDRFGHVPYYQLTKCTLTCNK